MELNDLQLYRKAYNIYGDMYCNVDHLTFEQFIDKYTIEDVVKFLENKT